MSEKITNKRSMSKKLAAGLLAVGALTGAGIKEALPSTSEASYSIEDTTLVEQAKHQFATSLGLGHYFDVAVGTTVIIEREDENGKSVVKIDNPIFDTSYDRKNEAYGPRVIFARNPGSDSGEIEAAKVFILGEEGVGSISYTSTETGETILDPGTIAMPLDRQAGTSTRGPENTYFVLGNIDDVESKSLIESRINAVSNVDELRIGVPTIEYLS